jgi:diguanylate cyclase (GGDEF)-like protein/PAS domain S-box-containing protein
VGVVSYMVESSAPWRRILGVLPPDLMIVDHLGVVRHVSNTFTESVGSASDDFIGRRIEEIVEKWSVDVEARHDRPHGDGESLGARFGLDLTMTTRGGARVVPSSLLSLALGGSTWTVLAFDDRAVSDPDANRRIRLVQFAAAAALAESEERFRHAFEDNMAPMMLTDLENRITDVNAAFCQMIGWSKEELLGSNSIEFTYPEDLGISETTHRRMTSDELGQARYVKRYLHKDGRVIVVEISKATARDAFGKTQYFVLSERDITQERALSAQLAHQALHDPLTGLANRAVFEDRLAQAHARLARHGGIAGVLLLDLDDFKGVNDAHGHLVSDHVLVTIAERLEEVTRTSDTLCRFGDDEFLYLAEHLSSIEEVDVLAARLLEVFTQPIPIVGSQLEVHASVGVVVWDGTSSDYQRIIQHADDALYEAKRRGKGGYVRFDPEMELPSVSRFALAQELRHALHNGQLSMHYQPILELATNEVRGFEALMRWQHPERGWVPPTVFIPLAEQSDLIYELGAFALREAIAAASSWPSGIHGEPFVTVNLSSRQFHDPQLVSMIIESLASNGLVPERLVVEITESVTLLDVAETLSVIEQLHRLDISVALDDFGTGYSSLSYLTQLRPAILKIDRSFVSPQHENVSNDTLLQTIVSLGQRLNMIVLAEGIETMNQFERLQELGCELGQGFLFSRAVPAGDVAGLLTGARDAEGVA